MAPQTETIKTTGKVEKNAMQASEFSGLASDSRDVKPGYLFAALAGSKMNGAAFLRNVVAGFPYKIHKVLTDNGMAFADLPKNREGPTR